MGELTSKRCFFLVALVFLQTVFCRECGTRGFNTRKKRLISNEDSKARITEWPWMVGIVNKTSKTIHCSGSLISDRFVLTAAHCVDDIENNENFQLVFGTDDLSNEFAYYHYRQDREIKQSMKHPKHDKAKGTHYYDVGIFEIDGEDLAFSDGITPICLPKKAVYDVDSRKGDGVTLTGFGKKSKVDSAKIEDVPLRFAQLEIYAQQRCNESYASVTESIPDLFQSNIMCASYQIAGEGSCKGDSGGPLVSYVSDDRYYEQVAIVSGKKGQCGNKNYPDIYVRLEDYEVLKWIYNEAFGSNPGRDPTDSELSILKDSAKSGNLAAIVRIVEELTDINPVVDAGKDWTILHIAAYYGQLNIVQYFTNLLEDKNPGKKSGDKFDGRTPMHYAAQKGHPDVVKHFVELLQDKNPSDINGYTPLHNAAENGHIKVVEMLVPLLEDNNPKSGEVWDKRTPLDNAARKGHSNVVEYLAPLVDDEESIRTAINYAKENNHGEIVKFLRETHPSLILTPTDEELSELDDAAKTGNLAKIIQITQALTDINPVVNDIYWTVLHKAAYYGQLNIVQYYTERLEDKNPGKKSGDEYDGRTPMHFAAQKGHPELIKHFTELLQDKNPSDTNGYTPLHNAAENGHIKVVELLVPLLEDKNPKSGVFFKKRTPLDNAAWKGHSNVVEYLAPLVDDDESISTAINYAKENDHSFVVKFLRETHPSLVLTPTDEELSELDDAAKTGNLAKIIQITQALTDINPVVNENDWTVLHKAAYYGQLNIVQYYTERLEDKNPGKKSGDEYDGRTPMHFAAQKGHIDVVKHFAELLQDKNPSDTNGYTPLHNTAENGYIKVVELLVPLLEDINPKSGVFFKKRTPLDNAAWKGHSNVVEYLAPNVDDDESIRTAINYAKQSNHSDIVKFLRETHPSLVLTPTDSDLSELEDAAKTGNLAKIIQITQALTDINPVVDNNDWTVLHNAAYYDQLNVVKYYTDRLEEKNPGEKSEGKYDGRTPMHYAAQEGHLNVVKHFAEILEDKNPSDIREWTPLHSAANNGHIKVVEILVPFLEEKNPKAGQLWRNRTPLDNAAEEGHLEVVSYFSPLVVDEDPIRSAINYAKENNHVEIVKFLRETHPSLVLTPTAEELSELDDAAKIGNLAKIIQITQALTDINPVANDKDWTVLHIAAYYGQLNIVQHYTDLLEDKNPGKKSGDKFDGRTPMHYAAQKGHPELVKHFTELLQDKNPSDTNGYTPLHNAAENGHIKVVEMLVPLLEDKNPKSGVVWDKRTPLDNAARRGHLNVVEYLAQLVDDEESIKTAIKYAKEKGHNEIVTFLISSKKTPAGLDLSELEDAVKSGDLTKIITITNGFTDINPVIDNIRYWTVLHKAAFYGHLNIVKYYTDQLINPRNEFGTTPLHIAAQKGQLDVMKHLVPLLENKNPKAGVFMDEGTPFEYAASAGHLNVVQYLTPFVEDDEEVLNSAIESAKKKGHTEIVEYLKELNSSLGRTSTYPEDEFTTINPFEDYDEERLDKS